MPIKDRNKFLEYQRKYSKENSKRRVYNTKLWRELPGNKERRNELSREQYIRRRYRFINMYGGKCACCGETIIEFLSLDHVLGQVGKRKETTSEAISKALKEYRPDIYQILCHNCNQAKGYYGICPHQRNKEN